MTELLLLYRYLATGDSFRSVAFCFRVGASTAAGIVNEVCQPKPDAAEWRKIAAEFSHLAFPNCLGAWMGNTSSSKLLHPVVLCITITKEHFP